MKNITLFAVALATLYFGNLYAQEPINLTPVPKEIKVGQGVLTLPQRFTVNVNGLADSVKAEAEKFVKDYVKVSGAEVSIVTQKNPSTKINLSLHTNGVKIGPEAYKLKITEQDISIEAETSRGFYYAFQSLKKLMPPCVMAGVKDPKITTFVLPVVEINDAPKFSYRGYMLDVCRHFFTVDEIKRILDVMSYYKMNKFHWHLTEDQGWRVEIKKYPKLTAIAGVREFSWNTEYIPGGRRYRTYEPYGPYFYTQEEIKDVIKYAQDRHIDIIPEVDMPGHFAAAMTAYPQYSCNPSGSHHVWCDGGISSDVLNVANPQAVQFAKDIMTELMELFPYPYFHIGGDECPTTAWENNQQCKEMMKEFGYTNYRQLQSHFIHELADHAATYGKKLYVWNEAISASGADVEMIKNANATVMCWTGADAAAKKAAKLGLNNVLTPQPTLYINRKAGTDPNEPHAVGSGNDATLRQVYNYNPGNDITDTNLLKYYLGVQGTFWTEHVSEAGHMEYLTLPRLIAIAETGWSPREKKNFDDFCNRMKKDTVLLNYNNYQYAPYHIKEQSSDVVLPKVSTLEKKVWYRLVTMAGDQRNNMCLELLREGAPQIARYSGNGAQVGRLWSSVMAAKDNEAYDYQWWALVEDVQNKGKYALVCKAFPNGSVNPIATVNNNTGRWTYDQNAMHYNFTIETGAYYGKKNDNYYYAIKSDQHANNYFNMGAGGQGYAVNLYGNPADGKGGLWEFQPLNPITFSDMSGLIAHAKALLDKAAYYKEGKTEIGKYDAVKAEALKAVINKSDITENEIQESLKVFETSLGVPQNGDQIRITNAVIGSYKDLSISEIDGLLKTSKSKWSSDIWVVESNADNCFSLKNLVSGKYINGNANPLTLGAEKSVYKYSFSPTYQDFILTTYEGKALFPVSTAYVTNPGCIYVDGIRPQGAAWNMEKVWQVKYECIDTEGNNLGSYFEAVADGANVICNAPKIPNFEVLSYGESQTEAPVIQKLSQNQTIKVVYKRIAYTLTFDYRDEKSNQLYYRTDTVKIGESVQITYPEIPYYTFKQATVAPGNYTPSADKIITAVYTTDALYVGFKAVGECVTTLEAGKQYLFYDAASADERRGFINVAAGGQVMTTKATEGSPAYVWTLMAGSSKNQFKVMSYNGGYIPALPKGSAVITSNNGDNFTFTLNPDNETWKILGSNGRYWNGNAGSMTGWSDAHNYKAYAFVAVPYFEVRCSYVDDKGNIVTGVSASTTLVKAGDPYQLNAPELAGYEAPTVNVSSEQLKAVGANQDIRVVYKKKIDTSIGDVKRGGKKNGKLYDLNGRELKKATLRGIYIEKGEKIIK